MAKRNASLRDADITLDFQKGGKRSKKGVEIAKEATRSERLDQRSMIQMALLWDDDDWYARSPGERLRFLPSRR